MVTETETLTARPSPPPAQSVLSECPRNPLLALGPNGTLVRYTPTATGIMVTPGEPGPEVPRRAHTPTPWYFDRPGPGTIFDQFCGGPLKDQALPYIDS